MLNEITLIIYETLAIPMKSNAQYLVNQVPYVKSHPNYHPCPTGNVYTK